MRVKRLEQAPDTGPNAMVHLLARVTGIGIETADTLVREVLTRNLRDRAGGGALRRIDGRAQSKRQLQSGKGTGPIRKSPCAPTA